MRTDLQKLALMTFLCLAGMVSTAYARIQLDFFEPPISFIEKAEEVKSEIEKEINTYTEGMIEKVKRAMGAEGAALFDAFVLQHGRTIINNVMIGQFNANDFTASGFMSALTGQLNNYKADLATIGMLAEDYKMAKEAEKTAKNLEIQKQLTELRAQKAALQELYTKEPSEDLAKKLQEAEQSIANLEAQSINLLTAQVDLNTQKYDKLTTEYSDKINQISEDLSPAKVQELLKTETLSLFSKSNDKSDQAKAEALYNTLQSRLFLGENDAPNAQNIQKVLKERRKEALSAEQHAFKTVINTNLSLIDTGDRYNECSEAVKQAEGKFGAEAMNVCVILQQTKAAAQYMEILLAEIRLSTTKEMAGWTNKFKLNNYDRDPTEFDLDDYVLSKESFMNSGKKLGNFKL